MFEIGVYKITIYMVLFTLLLYSIAYIRGLKTYANWPFRQESIIQSRFWLIFFIVFALTYTIGADFFHYKEVIYEGNYHSLEDVYVFIIDSIHHNYFLFRLIVFGSALLIYDRTLQLFHVDRTIGLLLLLICFGGSYSYARASLAFTIFYFGLTLFISDDRKFVLKIIGIIIIFCSFFFHRSMALMIALAPFVFFKQNKRTILMLIFATPMALLFFNKFFGLFMDALSFDETISRRMDFYGDLEQSKSNWKGIIGNVICHYGMYVFCFYLVSKPILNHELRILMPKSIIRLYSFLSILIYVSVISYFLMDTNLIFMHRYLKMTVVPFIILLSYLYKNGYILPESMKYLLYFTGFGTYWQFIGTLL